MLVFWKEKLAILSQAKTGSTALQHAIGSKADIVITDPAQLKHATIQRYNRFFRPMFRVAGANDIETVALVREPFDWLGSWYRYRSRPLLDGTPNSTAKMSFDDFALAYIQPKRPDFADVGSQARFLRGAKGDLRTDHVFRYEDMAQFIAFLEDRIGEKINLPRVNASPKMKLTLTADTKKALKTALSVEYEIWKTAKR
ncbi:gamma-glutamyl kinase [Parasulfitobacter algicola]|uniref:Gamma-glutamyl kinase n=1 Tax=Parasulfitobacter algicola TaxID=2614809 RepID=A0ABX2IYA8_9RHOB|nr:gamma-glutamyl kinase [Sulfitobacter algicola]NSX55208.1 gamma-glutamyl kinase [Sulfitobacter algicola]